MIVAEETNQTIARVTSTQCRVLFLQIIVAQLGAILITVVPSAILGGEFYKHIWACTLLVLVGILYFGFVYSYKFQRKVTPQSALLLQRYRGALGFLIFIDCIIILGQVGLSGGIIRSQTGFVLLLVPAMVSFIRGGGKTFLWTSIGIMVAVIWEVVAEVNGASTFALSFLLGDFLQNIFHFANLQVVNNPELQPRYPWAYSAGFLIGIIATILQDRLATGRSIPDSVRQGCSDKIRKFFAHIEDGKWKDLENSVEAAHKKAHRLILLTNEPELHMSVVHPMDDTVCQALLLASPGLGFPNTHKMRQAAEMVFESHWLDDMFDHIGYGKIADIKLESSSSIQIANAFSPYGLKRVVERIKRVGQWSDGTEIGLTRVILAGFVQSGNDSQRKVATKRIRENMLTMTADFPAFVPILEKANTVFYWGTSKTAMPLIVGSFWDEKTEHLGARCVLLDSLLMPLLVWHDLKEEIERETVAAECWDGGTIYEQLEAATQSATQIINAGNNVLLLNGPVWKAFKPIAETVYKLFQSRLPNSDSYTAYKSAFKRLLNG